MTGRALGTPTADRRLVVSAVVGGLIATLVVAGFLVLRGGGLDDSPSPGRAEQSADSIYRQGASKWRMASFNVLGSGHTDGPNADRPEYASAKERMGYTVRILKREELSLVGFQEMRLDQYDEFNRLTGSGWDVWPDRPENETVFAQRHIANSLAWRTDTWSAVRREVAKIRYINDESTVNYPVVWLRHQLTGQTVIAANFHNVSDKFDDEISGGSAARRAEEVAAQIELANRLRSENPGVPVFFTGDFNERESFFCKIVSKTALRAANGGWATSTRCQPPPAPLPVDWILGSEPATLSNWAKLWKGDELVQKTTDHPVVVAQAAVPPARALASGVDHVVLLSVEGVRSRTIVDLGSASGGFLHIRKYGASTLNARTVERPLSLSNVTSMLTGKPINRTISGHGVVDGTSASTVHSTAGRYVTSVMDLLHDRGKRTALFTNDPGAAILDRSWNARNGAADITWTDNGRDKVSSYSQTSRPTATARQIYGAVTSSSPASFIYGQLSAADVAGHAHGFSSQAYRDAVVRVGKQVNSVLAAIRANPAMAGRTLVVVAGEHGGSRRSHTSADVLSNVRVPLMAWGAGVPRGADLYAMNPDYTDPGSGIPGYHGGQPLRPSLVANLITAVFAAPAIPGSTMNTQQNFTVFGAP